MSDAKVRPDLDLAYWAWTIIANVPWDDMSEDWAAAAKTWRDAFHAALTTAPDGVVWCPVSRELAEQLRGEGLTTEYPVTMRLADDDTIVVSVHYPPQQFDGDDSTDDVESGT